MVYFTFNGYRYNPELYIDDGIIYNYEIVPGKKIIVNENNRIIKSDIRLNSNFRPSNETIERIKHSLWKHVDDLQLDRCCGYNQLSDWPSICNGFIPKSCCKNPFEAKAANVAWSAIFDLNEETVVQYCVEGHSEPEGCLDAMKDDEEDKKYRLGVLLLLMGIISTANTIVSLLSFALSNIEKNPPEEDCELSIMGGSTVGGQPAIVTSMKPRPSIVSGTGDVAVRAQAVRFKLSNSPRQSISGPSKFSAAARRGSSFI